MHVRMEAILARHGVAYLIRRLRAGIQVVVHVLDLIEDEVRVISVYLAVGVFGLEGVTLNDQEGIVVVLGNLCRLPRKFVHIYMPVPLSHNYGLTSVHHKEPVEHADDGVVSPTTAPPNIYHDKISIRDALARVYLGLLPNSK